MRNKHSFAYSLFRLALKDSETFIKVNATISYKFAYIFSTSKLHFNYKQ